MNNIVVAQIGIKSIRVLQKKKLIFPLSGYLWVLLYFLSLILCYCGTQLSAKGLVSPTLTRQRREDAPPDSVRGRCAVLVCSPPYALLTYTIFIKADARLRVLIRQTQKQNCKLANKLRFTQISK